MSGLNEEKPVSRVRCTQEEFYVVADTIIGSYEQRKAVFILNSTKYTNTTGTDLLTELEAAQLLPSDVVRTSRHAELRIELVGLNLDVLRRMHLLDGYIRDGFDAAIYNEKRKQAGFDLYGEAYDQVWPSMKNMLTTASTFIADQTAALTTGGMPGAFAADFNALKTATLAKLQAFVQEEEEAGQGTVAKVEANNALYDKLIALCDDGQKFFWDEPGIREEFIYEAVLRLVKDTSTKHRVGGTVVKREDDTPLVLADMLLERLLNDGTLVTVEEVKTDIEGKYGFSPVRNGKYRVTASYVDRVTERKDIIVNGGPVTVDFKLVLE